MEETKIIRAQPGYQTKVLSNSADIIISGAAAGVGKTFTLLLDPTRDIKVKDFGGVIFRRTSPQIRNEGGLWDTSMNIYPGIGAVPKESSLEWIFPKGSKLKFSHLEYEKNIYDWQGAQIPFIGFDELTHFTRKMFFYLLTRNRSVCGVKPYCRATCNPDPESWVYELIRWWIDEETGLPIPERDGVIRYMLVDGENYIWGDTYEEVIEKGWYLLEKPVTKSGIDPKEFVKSITFISGSIYDNKELLSVNPSYLGNLMAQDEETKAQLMDGNWKAIISDKDIYDYYAFIGLFENKYEVSKTGNYITADIAMKGSNKFVVGHYTGFELDDLLIMDISKGNEVIDGINNMAIKHKTPNSNIVFDNDGVGQFVDGFIVGAREFNNGSSPLPDLKNPKKITKTDSKGKQTVSLIPENYEHLKAQCYYRSGNRVNKGEMKISEYVASMMYDTKMTVRQRFIYERKAIKRDKADMDGKLRIIKKDEMKTKLNGDSPDMMDMWMMREWFELVPKRVYADAQY